MEDSYKASNETSDLRRRQIEEALAEAEGKYRSLVEESLVGVYLIQDGHFAYVNPRMAEIFGYTRDELLDGMAVMDTVAPEDRQKVTENLRKRIAGEAKSIHYSFRGLRKDGGRIDIEVLGSTTSYDGRPAVIGSLLDVTERKQTEQALRESEEMFRKLFHCANDAIFLVEMTEDGWPGPILEANDVACERLGYRREELLQMSVKDVDSPETWPSVREALQELMEHGHSTFERVHLSKDGRRIPVEISAHLFELKGKRVCMAIARDITERKRIQEERLERRERELRIEAEAEQAKRVFYRETILSVTGGKLDICDEPAVRPFIEAAEMCIEVRDAAGVSSSRQEICRYCHGKGMDGSDLDSFMLGVGEAITNAVKHGSEGRVYAGAGDAKVWVGVEDKGKGIESLILPRAVLLRGFSTKPSLGLGYSIMLDVADRILLKTDQNGTTVILEKGLGGSVPEMNVGNLPDTWESPTSA